MGLATIGPHSLKEHTKIHNTPKFGVNRPSSEQDTAIYKFLFGSVRQAIHFFVKF